MKSLCIHIVSDDFYSDLAQSVIVSNSEKVIAIEDDIRSIVWLNKHVSIFLPINYLLMITESEGILAACHAEIDSLISKKKKKR